MKETYAERRDKRIHTIPTYVSNSVDLCRVHVEHTRAIPAKPQVEEVATVVRVVAGVAVAAAAVALVADVDEVRLIYIGGRHISDILFNYNTL